MKIFGEFKKKIIQSVIKCGSDLIKFSISLTSYFSHLQLQNQFQKKRGMKLPKKHLHNDLRETKRRFF